MNPYGIQAKPNGNHGNMINQHFKGIFSGKKVLLTGHTGFKGSWLSIWLREMNAEVFGYALAPKTERDNFVRCGLERKMTHRIGDVTDFEGFSRFAKEVQPDVVFHLAAQPLVLQSYDDPRETYQTNLMGTVNFLEIVRHLPSVRAAVNVTSDKCYDNKEWVWGYRENDAMGGKDPYSSSKGCSELITAAYTHSFFMKDGSPNVASARAGNVIGGGDWAENRIVPDFFRAHLDGKAMMLRNPRHTRPWQHVLEPLAGYLQLGATLIESGKKFSGGWNFGPSDSNNHSTETLIKMMIRAFGSGSFTTPTQQGAPHEAELLKLDVSKAAKHLGWLPALTFEETVRATVEDYRVELNGGDIYAERVARIKDYGAIAANRHISWAS